MSYLDVLIAIPLVFGLIRGFMKGFIVEVTSVMAIILGIYGAILFSNKMATFLNDNFDWSVEWTAIIAFILVFAAILILTHLLARIVEKGIKLAALGIVNKLAGSAIGFIKMALVVSALLLIIDKLDRHFEFMPQQQIQKSVLYQPFASLVKEHFPKIEESNILDRIKDSATDINDKVKDVFN